MATEQRLIDAYALMNQVRESKHKNPHEIPEIARNHMFEHDHFTKLICLAPTVDAVEVVRCRDCKHWDKDFGWCDKKRIHMVSDDFCSYGERKDND